MSEFFHHFGIDWRLLLAQAINFLLLLFLLKKFAFGPIIKMLARRRENIKRGIDLTKTAEEELREAGQKGDHIIKEAEREALSMVTDAQATAKKKQEEIMTEAHHKVEGIIEGAKKTIEEERAKMDDAVYRDAESLIRDGIAKVLGKMPSKERDDLFIKDALGELKSARKSV